MTPRTVYDTANLSRRRSTDASKSGERQLPHAALRSHGSILRSIGNWRRVLRHVIAWAGAFDGTAPSSGRFQDNPDPHGGVAAGEAARGTPPHNPQPHRASSWPLCHRD